MRNSSTPKRQLLENYINQLWRIQCEKKNHKMATPITTVGHNDVEESKDVI